MESVGCTVMSTWSVWSSVNVNLRVPPAVVIVSTTDPPAVSVVVAGEGIRPSAAVSVATSSSVLFAPAYSPFDHCEIGRP